MGGGADSRIPSILAESFRDFPVNVVCRTYSFDPDEAHLQIMSWFDEVRPDLVIGESLGSLHALRLPSVPLLFVSPALNASLYFEFMAWLTLIPGVSSIFDRIYKPSEGDRQPLHFSFKVLRKYLPHRKAALTFLNSKSPTSRHIHAFFGDHDHYRKSGVVSIKSWKYHIGESFTMYQGSHFMEEEYIYGHLIPKILSVLSINK